MSKQTQKQTVSSLSSRLSVFCLAMLLLPLSWPKDINEDDARRLYMQGRYQQVLDLLAGESTSTLDMQRLKASALSALGRYSEAETLLRHSLENLKEKGRSTLHAILDGQLGSIYLKQGRINMAKESLRRALNTFVASGDTQLGALTSLEMGHAFMVENHPREAQSHYSQALRHGDKGVQTEAGLYMAESHLLLGDTESAVKYIQKAQEYFLRHPSAAGVRALNLAALLYFQAAVRQPGNRELLPRALQTAQQAEKKARTLADPSHLSNSLGIQAEIYRYNGQFQDADILNTKALFHAQQNPSLLFRWHWQAAKLSAMEKRYDEVLQHYRRAAETEARVRHAAIIHAGTDIYRDPTRFYFEFVEFLIDRSQKQHTKHRQAYLREARDLIERHRASELQDYFHDDCVANTRAKYQRIDHAMSSDTVVLYTILFEDRLELLLSHENGIKHFRSRVSADKLREKALAFRTQMERRRTRDYLPLARQLYDWLIKPIRPELEKQGIRTLVVIPDRIIRTIALGALHDGEKFLIESVAIAVSPGLELMAPRHTSNGNIRLLLGGLSHPVQGYPGLPHVRTEIGNIHNIFGGDVLLDKGFVSPNLRRKLNKSRYTIAHVASHGEFNPTAGKSFILTYDGKLGIDRLSRYIGYNLFRDQPLDLLVLSACQTAAGDDRAALGLGGITVKAGSRSALATLWQVSDRATAKFMTELYRQIKQRQGKAKALRNTQLKMLEDVRYRHPGFWSGFILIGNWQ